MMLEHRAFQHTSDASSPYGIPDFSSRKEKKNFFQSFVKEWEGKPRIIDRKLCERKQWVFRLFWGLGDYSWKVNPFPRGSENFFDALY